VSLNFKPCDWDSNPAIMQMYDDYTGNFASIACSEAIHLYRFALGTPTGSLL
jgi:hypothetical protein